MDLAGNQDANEKCNDADDEVGQQQLVPDQEEIPDQDGDTDETQELAADRIFDSVEISPLQSQSAYGRVEIILMGRQHGTFVSSYNVFADFLFVLMVQPDALPIADGDDIDIFRISQDDITVPADRRTGNVFFQGFSDSGIFCCHDSRITQGIVDGITQLTIAEIECCQQCEKKDDQCEQ